MAADSVSIWGIVLLLAVASCGDDADNDGPGLPNPASVYCEEQGGTLEIVTGDTGGQVGICVLPNGERIEEWELFRRDTTP